LDSRYCETLEFLGAYRRVVFFDQRGCGATRELGGYASSRDDTRLGAAADLAAVCADAAEGCRAGKRGDPRRPPAPAVHVLAHGAWGGAVVLAAFGAGLVARAGARFDDAVPLSPAAEGGAPTVRSLTFVSCWATADDVAADRRAALDREPAAYREALLAADEAGGARELDRMLAGAAGGDSYDDEASTSDAARVAWRAYVGAHVHRRDLAGCLLAARGTCDDAAWEGALGPRGPYFGPASAWPRRGLGGLDAGALLPGSLDGVNVLVARGALAEPSAASTRSLEDAVERAGGRVATLVSARAASAPFLDDWEPFLEVLKVHLDDSETGEPGLAADAEAGLLH